MVAVKTTKEHLSMFIIGKSKLPKCFENITQLPCQYQKPEMDDWKLFKEWVKVLDGSFRAPGRNAVPLISNCLVHLQTEDLSNIGLIFLPPNTTSDVSSNETRGQLFNPLNDNHTHSNNSIQEPCPISKTEHFTKGFILDV